MRRLDEILQAAGVDAPQSAAIEFKGFNLDSRTLQPGEVFCASAGHTQDGTRYIPEALNKGAVAVLYDAGLRPEPADVPLIAVPDLSAKLSALAAAFYHYPSRDLNMIGVTGTNGKTSVTQYFAQALDQLQAPCGILGTVGNGRWGRLAGAKLTTPDAISVQSWLAQFRDEGMKAVAMEVSSHGLVQQRVAAVEFKLAVFTNLTQDHLDFHHNMADYAAAKAKLFALPNLAYAALNADDAYVDIMAKALAPATQVLYYGLSERAEVRGIALQALPHGYRLRFKSPWGEAEWQIPLLGIFNIYNVLALITGLGLLGYDLARIEAAVCGLQGAKGRMEVIRYPGRATVIIDYAHTPDALEKALQAVRTHCPGKLWLISGCGGDRDRSKRPIMAKIAVENADRLIVTEDNNRFEAFTQIVDDMRPGFLHPDRVTIIPKRADAIRYALQHADSHDSVLLANKGHENYLDICGVKQPFDEREVVKQVYGLSV